MHGGRKRHVARLAAFVVVTTLAGTLASSASAAKPPTPEAADAALDQALQKLVQAQGGPPGAISVVQRGDEVTAHAAGVADMTAATPPAADDHVRIASVSKAFSGAVALALVADGTLSLGDTIGKRLPTLPKAWKRVTLGQALQHTSGIPDFATSKGWTDAVNAAPLQPPASPAELLSYVKDKALAFEPGSEYRYSQSDNVVVGLMVEAATSRPYEDVLQERALGPLGLTATSLPRDATMPTPYVHGYTVAPPNPPQDLSEGVAMGWLWATAGIVSTPADANRFGRGYATGATTNKATATKQFRFRTGTSDVTGPGANAAGLGIYRYRTRCGTVYGHTGTLPGYTTFVAATRDGARSATVSVNAQISPGKGKQHFPALRKIFELATCAALAGA